MFLLLHSNILVSKCFISWCIDQSVLFLVILLSLFFSNHFWLIQLYLHFSSFYHENFTSPLVPNLGVFFKNKHQSTISLTLNVWQQLGLS